MKRLKIFKSLLKEEILYGNISIYNFVSAFFVSDRVLADLIYQTDPPLGQTSLYIYTYLA